MNINVPVSTNHPTGYTIIGGSQPPILTSPATTPLQPNQATVASGGDIHICGPCGSQFTEIEEFITHKRHGCQNNATATVGPAGNALQQQIPSAPVHHATHGSVVGMPIGMPHVILQAPSGHPQMYRIVLEPSVNTPSSQGQSILAQALAGAQVPHLPPSPTVQPVQHTHTPHSPHQQENVSTVMGAVTTSSGPTNSGIIHLQNMSGTWPQHSTESDGLTATGAVETERVTVDRAVERSVIETNITTSTANPTPGPMDVCQTTNEVDGSNDSNMHTEEEDVATFLATQLASQAVPQQSAGVVSEHMITSVVNGVQTAEPQLQYTSAPTQQHLQPQQLAVHHQQHSMVFVNDGLQNVRKNIPKDKTCPVKGCNFTTTHNKDLNRHIRKHTGEKPYRCEDCGACFSRSDKLKVHTRIHTNVRPYWCQEPGCQYRAIDSGSLRKHTRTHTDERPYRCQLCTYSAKDSSQLTVHLRTHTGDTPFQCMVENCSAAFKTSSDLRRHERLHTGVKPYKCSSCDYASAIKSNLTVHMRLNHFQGAKFSCLKCEFQGNSRRQLKEHEKSHSNVLLQCELCEHVSTSTTSLRQHMLIHSQEKPFQCRYCSFTCKTTGNLRYHVRNKHGCDTATRKRGNSVSGGRGRSAGGNSAGGRRSNRPACYRRFKCSECGSGFVREDSWRCHMRQHQKHKMAQTITAKMEPDVFSVVVQDEALMGIEPSAKPEKLDGSAAEVATFSTIQSLPSTGPEGTSLPSQTTVSVQTNPEHDGSESAINGYNSYVITIDGISTVFSNPVHLTESNANATSDNQPSETVEVITGDILASDSKVSASQETFNMHADNKVPSANQDYRLTHTKIEHTQLYDLTTGDKVIHNQNTFTNHRQGLATASEEYLSHAASQQVQQTILIEQKPKIDNIESSFQGHDPTKLKT